MTHLFAEFAAPEAVVTAIERLRGRRALRDLDAYTPYPVHEIEHALAIGRSRIPFICFATGIAAAAAAYLLQWWMNAYDYPLNVGGRPPHMPSAFVPVTFEMGVLGAAFTAFVCVLWRAGMPRLWRPAFEVDGFESASVDRFWLTVHTEPGDHADLDTLRSELVAAGALRVVEHG